MSRAAAKNACVAIDLRCRGDRLVSNKLQHEMLVICKRDALGT